MNVKAKQRRKKFFLKKTERSDKSDERTGTQDSSFSTFPWF